VFEAQRENLFMLVQQPQEWINSLPRAFHISKKGRFARFKDALPPLPKGLPGRRKDQEKDDESTTVYDRLPEMLELIEAMIESERRFQMYGAEVEAVCQLGMSFQDWIELTPPSVPETDHPPLMYILPPQSVKLAA
jgi:hypothetical protein